MKPFNPEKAQFYYDTASSFQDALVKSSNQLLEYEDKIRTLKNENDELKKQVDSLVSNLAAAHEDRNEEAKSVFLAKQVEIPELLRENAALRTVLKRWLKVADDCHREQQEVGYSEYNITAGLMVDTCALLDAARKEAQP